jgi:hypothetical protein
MSDLDNEYLEFVETWPETRKTAKVFVNATRDGAPLGEIIWFGRWRQYAFMPEPGTVFNVGCMATIISRIDDLMERRRNFRSDDEPAA